MIVLSHVQAAALQQARQEGRSAAAVSPDLGLTQADFTLDADGVRLPDGQRLTWAQVAEIHKHNVACFEVKDGGLEKIQQFSHSLNRFYSLRPTTGAPTMLVASFPMHRFKGIDPQEDTRRKIAAIAPLTGRVLDTATGLGYTAIEAARAASQVVTVEIDPVALGIARRNPWSQALFDNPRIEQRIGSTAEVIRTFPDSTFSAILHDPPTLKLAGELYSGAFYRELFRVLRRGGRLFHYIGDLDSTTGHGTARGAARRLQEAGFTQVTRRPEAFGLSATRA